MALFKQRHYAGYCFQNQSKSWPMKLRKERHRCDFGRSDRLLLEPDRMLRAGDDEWMLSSSGVPYIGQLEPMRLSLWIPGEPIRRFGIKWGSVVKYDDDHRTQETILNS